VQKYCSLTEHVWDGNWLIANARKWNSLPKDVQEVIARHFDAAAVKQRADVLRLNTDLEASLQQRGLIFNRPEKPPFRKALQQAGFYAEWKKKYGPEAWAKLEQYTGNMD
jgi:TRAP-type C4-dicarboxylate transport system substrate-binding protein